MDRSLTTAATWCFGSSHNIRHDSFDTLMLTTVQYIYIIYIYIYCLLCVPVCTSISQYMLPLATLHGTVQYLSRVADTGTR